MQWRSHTTYQEDGWQPIRRLLGRRRLEPTISQTAGVQYQAECGPGMRGWTISNSCASVEVSGQRRDAYGAGRCV